MNWDQVAGNWKQVKGKLKEKWGKLTDDDLEVVEGKRDQLAGLLQSGGQLLQRQRIERVGRAADGDRHQAGSVVKQNARQKIWTVPEPFSRLEDLPARFLRNAFPFRERAGHR